MNIKLDLDKVHNLAKRMKEDVENDKPYDTEYDYLKEYTPRLYDLILAKTENFIQILEFMIKKLKQGKLTEEAQSEDVGKFLAEQYIYPNIDMTKENQSGSSSGS